MKKESIIVSVLLLVVVVGGLLILYNYENDDLEINSFEDCVAAGNPVMESRPGQCRANGELFVEESDAGVIFNRFVNYFSDRMFEVAVEKSDGLIPIEGFTPEMYLELFDNLEKSDFDGVRAINGFYELEDGELNFVMSSGQLITSADGTVNLEGMGDLLYNLRDRLGVGVGSLEDVDELIEMLG